ncbi:MAG TPA: hypothetical protein VGK90_11720 [Rhizomicrobium sp.]|jgi:hypothetical protein
MAFVIIGVPRTGSTHFMTSLNGHPEIFCNANIFKANNIQLSWPKEDKIPEVKKELETLRDKDPAAFLDRVLKAGYGRPHVGFEIFRGQHAGILNALIKDGSIKKIILYRKNILANFSSTLLASKTGEYMLKSGSQKPEAEPKVVFNPKRFITFHDHYVAFYRYVMEKLRTNSQPFYVMSYEDINSPQMMAAVIAFIGADPQLSIDVKNYTRIQKQNPSFIVSRFSNPDDVEAFLAEHNLLHWRYEGETALYAFAERARKISSRKLRKRKKKRKTLKQKK